MKLRDWYLSAVLILLAGAAVAGVVRWTAAPGATTVSVTVSIRPIGHGEFAFSPSSFHAPAGAVLQLTIVNFDPTNRSAESAYAQYTGPIASMSSGVMDPERMPPGGFPPMPAGQISHTFTVSGSGFALNIPIRSAEAAWEPSFVVVSIDLGHAGSYAWQCYTDGTPGTSGPDDGMNGTMVLA